jgi:ankyrin repeat protein
MDRRLESIRLLLKSGADASLSDTRGRTVLDYAAVSDDFVVLMRELITTKGLLPTKVSLIHSALQLARAHGAGMTVSLLLPLLFDSSENTDTAWSDREDVVLASRKKSTTFGKRDVLSTRGGPVVSLEHLRNDSQLHSAVRDASLDAVQELLASATTEAFDVNDVTIDGDTALHLAIYALEEAARKDNKEQSWALERIIETLLEHVNIEAENAFNEKAIHLAVRLIPDRHEALIAILEASIRSDVDVRTVRIPEAQQCLQSALTGERRCSARLVEVLLEGGASGLQPIGYDDLRLPREVAQQEELDEDVVEVLLRWEESL